MKIVCYDDKDACCSALADKIAGAAKEAVAQRGFFSLVLSGGTTPRYLYELLASTSWQGIIDWSKALIFFGDERCVGPHDKYSNYHLAHEVLLKRVTVDHDQVFRIRGEEDPTAEAKRYERLINTEFLRRTGSPPMFDLVLLGLGSDGHTASLFPRSEALNSNNLVTAVPAPQHMFPPVERVTLTFRAIAMSREICFLVHGESKEDIVTAVLQDKKRQYPASSVYGKALFWYLSGMHCGRYNQ